MKTIGIPVHLRDACVNVMLNGVDKHLSILAFTQLWNRSGRLLEGCGDPQIFHIEADTEA